VFLLFVNRDPADITVGQAESLGSQIAESQSVIHIVATSGFRRFSAIAHHSFGLVVAASFIASGLIKKLIHLSIRIAYFQLLGPRAIEFQKVIGCNGKMRLSSVVSSLELTNLFGGAVHFTIDHSRCNFDRLNFVETSSTSTGTFLRLHSFSLSPTSQVDPLLTKRLALKAFAHEILRGVWTGGDFENLVKKKLTPTIRPFLAGTNLSEVGSKVDRDTLKLYYVLTSLGSWPIENSRISPSAAFAIPSVFVFSEQGETPEIPETENGCGAVLEVRVVQDANAFQLLLEQNKP
jgi:hypothetical protein